MRYEQDEIDLTSMFAMEFKELFPNIPIDFAGIKFEVPSSGSFARFRVSRLPDSRLVATEGARKHYRAYGTVLVQLMEKSGNGTGNLLQVADKVTEIFRSKRLEGLVTRTPSVGPLVEEGNRQGVTVSIPFTSDYSL